MLDEASAVVAVERRHHQSPMPLAVKTFESEKPFPLVGFGGDHRDARADHFRIGPFLLMAVAGLARPAADTFERAVYPFPTPDGENADAVRFLQTVFPHQHHFQFRVGVGRDDLCQRIAAALRIAQHPTRPMQCEQQSIAVGIGGVGQGRQTLPPGGFIMTFRCRDALSLRRRLARLVCHLSHLFTPPGPFRCCRRPVGRGRGHGSRRRRCY